MSGSVSFVGIPFHKWILHIHCEVKSSLWILFDNLLISITSDFMSW